MNRSHIAHYYLTHSFISKKKKKEEEEEEEDAPVCGTFHVVVAVKQFLINCADWIEIGKNLFAGKSLYSLVRNVSPERLFGVLNKTCVFDKI